MPRTIHADVHTAEGRASRIAGIADDSKGQDIRVLDLRGIADFTDAFVLVTIRSQSHMQAMAQEIIARLKEEGIAPFVPFEADSPRWSIIDYGMVVVHLFDAATRHYYGLEELWGDAQELDWRENLGA